LLQTSAAPGQPPAALRRSKILGTSTFVLASTMHFLLLANLCTFLFPFLKIFLLVFLENGAKIFCKKFNNQPSAIFAPNMFQG
jgi:hypothetical protein